MLQNTRLSLVVRMARAISSGIQKADSLLRNASGKPRPEPISPMTLFPWSQRTTHVFHYFLGRSSGSADYRRISRVGHAEEVVIHAGNHDGMGTRVLISRGPFTSTTTKPAFLRASWKGRSPPSTAIFVTPPPLPGTGHGVMSLRLSGRIQPVRHADWKGGYRGGFLEISSDTSSEVGRRCLGASNAQSEGLLWEVSAVSCEPP